MQPLENGPQREPQQIHGLFPISYGAMAQAEVAMLQIEGASNNNLMLMRDENAAVLSYLVTTGKQIEQKSKGLRPLSFYLLGATLCYAGLRAEATIRRGIIPRIEDAEEDIIQDYIDYDLGVGIEDSQASEQSDIFAAWKQQREQRLKTLLNQEPALRKTLESNYQNLPSHMYTSLVNGIMDVYGIFHMNAEFQEANVKRPITDPIEDFVHREGPAIQQLALLYPLSEESAIPILDRDTFEELSRARLMVHKDPTAPVVEEWLARNGLTIDVGQRNYALDYISNVIAIKVLANLASDERYSEEEVDRMRQKTIMASFTAERMNEINGSYTREEMMQIREIVERSYKEKTS